MQRGRVCRRQTSDSAITEEDAMRNQPTVRIWIGTAVVGVLLASCAAQPHHPDPVPAAASPAQSYVVYPGPGTAAVENGASCQFARNTAVPAAKRSVANAECASLLSRATNPVTKPVPSTEPTVSPPAQPPEPECDSGQLKARFLGGGYGGGTDLGVIVVWNSGPQPCQLGGSVGFAAYYPGGVRDPNATVVQPITSGLVRLPAFMLPPRDGQDLSGYLTGYLAGAVLSVGSVTVRATNSDPGSVDVTSIYGCHGRVLLEDLQAPN
jgi:hypothetical protein